VEPPFLDRGSDPRLRRPAPFEERFYPLVAAQAPAARAAPALALLAVTAATLWLSGLHVLGSAAEALVYAAACLGLLGLGELSRRVVCRRHGVPVSLAYPVPLPPPFGALGLLWRPSLPPKTRRELFDTSLAAPCATFAAALGVLWLGRSAGASVPAGLGPLLLAEPLAARLGGLLAPAAGAGPAAGAASTADALVLAGCFGLFAVFAALLPAGGLPGGRIAYALLGRRASRIWLASVVACALLAAIQRHAGWLLWAALAAGARARPPLPLDPFARPGPARVALAVLAGLMLAASAMPFPIFTRMGP
jgi:membrane-associated protease RseP (regulator of RpoE activity)